MLIGRYTLLQLEKVVRRWKARATWIYLRKILSLIYVGIQRICRGWDNGATRQNWAIHHTERVFSVLIRSCLVPYRARKINTIRFYTVILRKADLYYPFSSFRDRTWILSMIMQLSQIERDSPFSILQSGSKIANSKKKILWKASHRQVFPRNTPYHAGKTFQFQRHLFRFFCESIHLVIFLSSAFGISDLINSCS